MGVQWETARVEQEFRNSTILTVRMWHAHGHILRTLTLLTIWLTKSAKTQNHAKEKGQRDSFHFVFMNSKGRSTLLQYCISSFFKLEW